MTENLTTTRLKKWLPLFVMSLALAIIIIDGTVLNVSIKYLQEDLGANFKDIQWTITLYSLVLVALTIAGGRLGDIFGRKKMFMLGAVLFGFGSLVASFATNIGVLIAGWSVLEGLGAALMMPATTSLIVSTYQGKDRGIAFGIWGGIAGAAAAFGPIVGGWLTTYYSWHWAFRINVFVVAILLIGSLIIKEVKDEKDKPTLDILGVILSALGLGSVVYGIIESSTYGWVVAKKAFELNGNFYTFPANLSISFITIITGILILALFIGWQNLREKQEKTPLLSLELFKNRQFVVGVIITSIISLGMSGIVFAVPFFYQKVRGLDAFDTGLGLLPLSLMMLVFAPLSAIFGRKISPKILISAGLVLSAFAAFLLRQSLSVDSDVWMLAPGLGLFGIGMGLMNAVLSNLTLSAVDVAQSGEASGVNATMRQLGSTLGSAIIGAVFLSTLTSSFTDRIETSSIIPVPVKTSLIAQIENGEEQKSVAPANVPKTQAQMNLENEITNLQKESTVEGNKAALVYTGTFIALGLLAVIVLPGKIKESGKSADSSNKVVARH